MFPAAVGGGILSGLGSLANSLINNAGSKRAQDRANRYNLEQWNRQNAYNHPVEQMARLKDAGLNPNLIYGSSPSQASGNADKVAPSKAADFNIKNPLEELGRFQDFRQKNVVTDNTKSQTDVNIATALLKMQQSAETISRTSKNKFDLKLAQELRTNSLEVAKENLRQMQNKTAISKIDLYVKNQTQANEVRIVAERLALLKEQKNYAEAGTTLRNLETKLKREGLENSTPLMRFLWKQFVEGKDNWIFNPFDGYGWSSTPPKNINPQN